MYTKVCTFHYVAPEIITSKNGYTEKVDIWSFGVLLFTMLAGAPPFNADNEREILDLVKAARYEFTPQHVWDDVSDDIKDLIRRCLTVDAKDRIDMFSIMESRCMTKAEEEGAIYTASEKLGRNRSGPSKQGASPAVKAAFSMMAEVITDDQVELLRAVFKQLDTKKTGMVELEDCVDRVKDLVRHNSGSDDLLKILDGGGIIGRVNYLMYLATMTDRRRHLRREAARAVFNNFDIDKNGNISLYEIAQALSTSEEICLTRINTVSYKEVQKIWFEMRVVFYQKPGDTIADREMTFDEFFKELPNSNKDIGF
jgi:calcium-dependent protein kinase